MVGPNDDSFMKKIDDKELFHNLSEFLKGKGVELHEGPYAKSIQKGCEILADTVNLSQQAMERAREQMDKHLDQMRQVIHERTAPKRDQGGQAKSGGKKPGRAKPAASRRKSRGRN